MQPDLNLLSEWRMLWRHRYYILACVAGACITTYILLQPFVYKPLYLSTASFSPPELGTNYKLYGDMAPTFYDAGEEDDVDRLAGALRTDTAMYTMVHRFSLIDHYGVRDEDPRRQHKWLRTEYEDNVQVEITRYATIQINVYDTDPALAARIANAYIAYADSFTEAATHRRASVLALQRSLTDLESRRDQVRSAPAAAGTARELETLSQEIAELYTRYTQQKHALAAQPTLISVTGYATTANYPTRPNKPLILLTVALATSLAASLAFVVAERARR